MHTHTGLEFISVYSLSQALLCMIIVAHHDFLWWALKYAIRRNYISCVCIYVRIQERVTLASQHIQVQLALHLAIKVSQWIIRIIDSKAKSMLTN